MSAPAETTAAMTPPAESHGTAATEPSTPADPAQPASAADPSQPGAERGAHRSGGRQHRTVSPNVIISLLGGLLTALLMWQFNALGNSIDHLGTELRVRDRQCAVRATDRVPVRDWQPAHRDRQSGHWAPDRVPVPRLAVCVRKCRQGSVRSTRRCWTTPIDSLVSKPLPGCPVPTSHPP